MNRFARFVVDHPYPVIIIIAVVTLVFGFMMKDLQLETDIMESLPRDIPEVAFYEEVQEQFPVGNMILVGLESQRLFTSEIIRLIDDLANEFTEIDGVIRVLAPTNIDLIQGTEWGMEVSPIIDQLPETSDEIDSFRRHLAENRMYSGLLVSEDEHAAAMIVTLDPVVEVEDIYEQMQSIIDLQTVEGVEYHISGQAAILVETAVLMNRDLAVLTPIVLAVLLIVLYLCFRSVRGVALPMLTVVVSLVWTFGIMALANIPLNIITTVLPVLLVAVGSAYGIHMLNRYFGDLAAGMEKKQAIVESVSHTGAAVLMAGLTTIAGFMALRSSPLEPIQEFGFLTAIG
ncbi:MAG: MMPL family transporter, partial [Spirochaetaceae bacterium]|nr:MMPL family transporter [Spirochaetaceae bacterium]